MNIVRTYPMGLSPLQRQINRIFEQFDEELSGGSSELSGGSFAPAMDVREDDDAYIVHLEVPGISRDDIELTIHDNTLVIRGSREQKQDKTGGQFRRVERSYGSFARALTLPRPVDVNRIEADLQDGVLEVRLPKSENARPRQISIGSSSGGSSSGGASPKGRTLEARSDEQAQPKAREIPVGEDEKRPDSS